MSLSGTVKDFGAGMAALYRRYAEWLVSITWKRFFVLSVLLLIVAGILSNLPPFSWDIATKTTHVPSSRNVDITVDEHGVRIKPKSKRSQAPEVIIDEHGVQIRRKADVNKPSREIIIDEHGVQMRSGPKAPTPPTPPSPPSLPSPKPSAAQSSLADDIRREVVEPLRREIAEVQREAAEEARQDADRAKQDARQAQGDAEEMRHDADDMRREVMDALSQLGTQERVVHIQVGDYLPQVAFLFIQLSAGIKIAYAGRVKAEA